MFALKPDPARYKGKTIMVVGAGRIQEPAIRIAKTLGLKVVAVDYEPGAPGLKWADYPLLISTTDVDACINAGRVYKIDGVMTAGSDRSSRTVAAVAKALTTLASTPSFAGGLPELYHPPPGEDPPLHGFLRLKRQGEYNACRQ